MVNTQREFYLWKESLLQEHGQIGTELVLKCREIYGNDNVLATDIREPEEDSPVNNGPFEVLDVTNREAMMAIVENFKADTLMHMVHYYQRLLRKSFISMGFKYGRSNERIRNTRRMNYISSHQVQLVHLVIQRLRKIHHKIQFNNLLQCMV